MDQCLSDWWINGICFAGSNPVGVWSDQHNLPNSSGERVKEHWKWRDLVAHQGISWGTGIIEVIWHMC